MDEGSASSSPSGSPRESGKMDISHLAALLSDYLLEFEIGPTQISFQVGTDEKWRPQFVQSSADILAEYLTPINVWIEENATRPSFAITDLLDYISQFFRQVASDLMQGNLSEEMSAKLIAELSNMMSNDARKKTKSSDGNEEGANPLATNAQEHNNNAPVVPLVPLERITATPAHFETEIFPTLRAMLAAQHFPPYQIDEWVRTIQVEVAKGGPEHVEEALRILKEDALNHADLPPELEKFYPAELPLLEQIMAAARASSANGTPDLPGGIPAAPDAPAAAAPDAPAAAAAAAVPAARRFPPFRAAQPRPPRWVRTGLTAETADRLATEAMSLRDTNATGILGFKAHPCNNVLAHWEVTLLGDSFDTSSPLGMQLVEWTMHHSSGLGNSNVVRPADVQVEMLMPNDFPARRPVFRVIAPRFKHVDQLNLTLSQGGADGGNRNPLSVSRDMEQHDADGELSSVAEIIPFLRERLSEGQVDLEAGRDGSLATLGGFWKSYVCVYPSAVGKAEQEHTGHISLPVSALEELFGNSRNRVYHYDGGMAQSGGPMTFELSHPGGRRSFCGVGEFTADEGTVIMPQWMAPNLGVVMGEEIHVRRVYVPKGVYMKLQPHNARYAKVGNTKRMLEWVLRRYTAVAQGDTLVINFAGEDHSFDILEVSPGHAIRLIDSDVAVDFAPPLSGEAVPKFNEDDDVNAVLDGLEEAGANSNNAPPGAPVTGAGPAASTPAAAPPQPTGQQLGQVEGVEGVDWKRCGNCRKGIPLHNYDRHTLMCAKHTWFCELCQVPVEKRLQEQHMQEQHSSVFCICGKEMEQREMASHKLADCPLRPAKCAFCKLGMTYREIYSHEKECGSKTEKCDQCGQFVRIRDLGEHHNVCGVPDVNGGVGRMFRGFGGGGGGGGGGGDDWGGGVGGMGAVPKPPRGRRIDDYLLCPHCNEPCEQLDDLQVHMLVAHPEAPAVDFGGDNASSQAPTTTNNTNNAAAPPPAAFSFNVDDLSRITAAVSSSTPPSGGAAPLPATFNFNFTPTPPPQQQQQQQPQQAPPAPSNSNGFPFLPPPLDDPPKGGDHHDDDGKN